MKSIRQEGKAVHALLVLLKNLTAHARWVFAILLIGYAFSGIRTIPPQEKALLLRFGKLQPKVHGPGLMLGLPDPFDRLVRFETGKEISLPLEKWSLLGNKISDPDVQVALTNEQLTAAVQNSENGGAAAVRYEVPPDATLDPILHGYSITSDSNIIQGRFALRFRIEDPFLYASAGEGIHGLLENLSYRAISAQLASRPIDQSLTSARGELSTAAAKSIQSETERLKLGLRISGIDILELSPPSQVLASFEDVTNARQFAKTLYENSRQYAAESIEASRGEAASILHRAQGHGEGLIAAATGESSSFSSLLTQYQRDPELISRRILRESLDTVMGSVQSRTLVPASQASPTITLEPSPQYSR